MPVLHAELTTIKTEGKRKDVHMHNLQPVRGLPEIDMPNVIVIHNKTVDVH